MPRLKKGNWTPKEDKILLKVKRGASTEKLRELATEWGRDYHNLYNHWMYLITKKEKEAGVDDSVMEFHIDTTITTPSRSDTAEIARMKRGLDLVIPDLQPNGGSIPIINKLAHSAKRHLEVTYPKHRFTISRERKGGKETGFSRIFKRY